MMPPSTPSSASAIIEHRRRPEADPDDVDAARGQARDQRRLEHRRAFAAVAADRDLAAAARGAPACRSCGRPHRRRPRPASSRRSRGCHIRAGRWGGSDGSCGTPSGDGVDARACSSFGEQRVAGGVDPVWRARPSRRRRDGPWRSAGGAPRGSPRRSRRRRRRAARAPRPAASRGAGDRAPPPPEIDDARQDERRGGCEPIMPTIAACARRALGAARLGQGEAGDHLAQFLARGDMGDADLADLRAGRAGSGPWGRARDR